MSLEITDVAGLSQPMTKLIEVVSSAVGVLYRPRAIRSEAEARAHEIKVIERAKIESETEVKSLQLQAAQSRIQSIAQKYPEIAERARLRLLSQEIEGQFNVEQIAEQAELALPSFVSDEPVSADWRRKFFKEAENVCEEDMQILWGKVLAGEISSPGSFSLRTLDTLRQLSRAEAELFQKACSLAMDDGFVMLTGFDMDTALMPFGFGCDEILKLRDAGLLLHGDDLHKSISSVPAGMGSEGVLLDFMNNGILIRLSGPALPGSRHKSLIFTQAGRELQPLIASAPNEAYLAALGSSLRGRGIKAQRATIVPQDDGSALLLFETDL